MKIRHLLAELSGCNSNLTNCDGLMLCLREGVLKCGATIVNETTTSYSNHGLTLITFLAESHGMITTWPEHNLALVDILLCNDSMDPLVALDHISEYLGPNVKIQKNIVSREIP